MNKYTAHALLLASGLMLSAAPVLADSMDPAMLSHTCAGCHGTFGASAGDSMPVIGGQPKAFLKQSMLNYREGKRHSTIMQRLAKGYDDAQLDAIAAFIADQKWVSAQTDTNPEKVAQGQKLHTTRGCAGCHGATGVAPAGSNTPRLAGQYPEYLHIQMKHYLNEKVTIPPSASVMRGMLKGSSDEDIQALAEFYASNK
jgi:sulfide dehydrogenase cytochrome subunit